MKKLLVSVLAIAGLVACSQEQTLVQSNNSGTLMEFNVAALDNATRHDPSLTTDNLLGFDVWAYVDSKAGTVLTGELVSRNGNMWSYVNKQYWTPDHTYYFDAIAPVDTDNFTNNWIYNQANDTIDFTNVDGTEDLIYAHEKVTTPEKFEQPMDAVGLEFNHLLSKVKFTFKNGFTTDNVYVAVENVKMVAPAAGTYTTTTGAWALENGTTTLAFGNVTDGDTLDIEGTKVFAAQKSVRAAHERFTIPAGADQNYVVTFTVKHYNGNVCLSSSDKEVKISGLNLESGKAYNFVTEINEQNAADTALLPIEFKVDVNGWEEVEVAVAEANSASDIQRIIDEAVNEAHIVLNGDINLDDLLTRAASSASITIPAGKEVVLDIKNFNITGTDNDTANFGMFNIQPGAKLTIEGTTGKIQLTANNNRGWNAYSSVISNQRGEFVLNGGTIEHLGGTDMAYGIDNLTNGKGTKAVTTINGGTVKSTYRAVRQFLNGTEAFNELYVNGGTIDGRNNKSIWMQDTNKSANTGKLVVAEGAQLKGDVYLFVTAGSTEWPVEVSIATSALAEGSEVVTGNVPAGYDVVEKNGNYVVEYGVEENGNEIAVRNAGGLQWIAQQVNSGADYFAGKTVKLVADIDLNNQEWTPIGSAYKDHGFMGNFDGNGFVIKNLAIKNIALDADNYAYAGLFGVTEGVDEDNQNYIKNLVIENVNIETTGHIVAAAIAYPYYTVLENIKVQGDVNIKGGDYTAGVLAYTRRCVDATNIAIEANNGSIEGNITIGGVISDIQMNGGLTANYSNFAASGLTIKGAKSVGGISGIISLQTLDGATVENVTIVCNDARKGIVAGALGGNSTINNASYENVTGATKFVGATYDAGKSCKVTINGVVYEYMEDGTISFDGKTGVSTADSLVAALEAGKDVFFLDNIKIEPASMSNAYGTTGINVKKGQTIDGNGYTLNIKGAGGTWDSGINTTGGVIKNLTVTGSFRGIFINHTSDYSEKVVLENVTLTGVTYTISCDQGLYQGIEATNCKFYGWTSFAKTAGEAKFVDCYFGYGNGNKYCRPYSNTEFVNCTFCPDYYVDTTRATVTFTDCTWEE